MRWYEDEGPGQPGLEQAPPSQGGNHATNWPNEAGHKGTMKQLEDDFSPSEKPNMMNLTIYW